VRTPMEFRIKGVTNYGMDSRHHRSYCFNICWSN
jgi:hypothetical protein